MLPELCLVDNQAVHTAESHNRYREVFHDTQEEEGSKDWWEKQDEAYGILDATSQQISVCGHVRVETVILKAVFWPHQLGRYPVIDNAMWSKA